MLRSNMFALVLLRFSVVSVRRPHVLETLTAKAYVLRNIMYYCNDKVSYINHSTLHKHNHQSDGIKVSAHQHSANFP